MSPRNLNKKTFRDLHSFYSGKKVVVTGGAGFIGSYMIPQLLELGAHVTIAHAFSNGKLKYLKAYRDQIINKETDLTIYRNCLKVLEHADIVINLAAKNTGIEYDAGHEHEMFTDNMLLQIQPLKAAAEVGVPYFLQVSSAVVYPRKSGIIRIDDVDGNPELSKSGYAYAKLMGEKLAMWYAKNTAMKVAIVRPNNAYGPHDEASIITLHVIPALIKKVLRGDNPVTMFGSGKQKRQFIHAYDFSRALLYVLSKKASHTPLPINVASEDEYTINEVYKKIGEALGEKRPVVHDLSMPEGPRRRYLDISELLKIGWRQQVPFDIGMKETVDFMLGLQKKTPHS